MALKRLVFKTIPTLMTSALVAGTLYVLVMERDSLRAFAQATPTEQSAEAEAEAVGEVPVSVVVYKSTAQVVENGLVLTGRTEAARNVDVRAETAGHIISEPLRKGQVVAEGDEMCVLDSGTREAELASAKARLVEAQTADKAASALAKRGFTAETAAASSRAALESAQAAVEQAEEELAKLTIRAPFSGILESDTAELGSYLQPGSSCATILSLDPIKLVGFVPEKSVNTLDVGTQAGARLITGQEVLGRVSFLSRSADEATRTFRVEVQVPNPDLKMRDGVTAEMFIALEGEKAHLLPQSVLTLDDEGRLGVRVDNEGVAAFLPVSVVRDDAEGIWLAGLPEEIDVIVVGQDFVRDGRSISVSYKEGL
ncbi:MAG: efflux RND transporter periplasmic adaptor subunit [Pseudomonadota bacterium]